MHIDWNKPQPAPQALWRLIHANFPLARNLGIYNRRNIAGTKTPSLHAEGRALDIGLLASKPTEKYLGDQLFEIFVDLADDLHLQEVIWNRQIWSQARPQVHPYTGHSAHTDHVHVGFTREGSQQINFTSELLIRIGEVRTGLEDLAEAQGKLG